MTAITDGTHPPGTAPPPFRAVLAVATRIAAPFVAVMLAILVVTAVAIAHEWPLVHDSPIMHYVVFLMDHGWTPYRDIIDINMPGAYLSERWAMRLFGGDASGWWLWDCTIGLTVIGASVWIAGSGARAGGAAAGALAWLAHLSDGPWDLGQRDWLVAALLLVAIGSAFETLRSGRAGWLFGFALCVTCASSIKPPAVVFGGAMLVAAAWLAFRSSPSRPKLKGGYAAAVMWMVLGAIGPVIVVGHAILGWGVLGRPLDQLKELVHWYTQLKPASLQFIGYHALVPLLAMSGAMGVLLLTRRWRDWDTNLLALAALMGAFLYVVQGKGFAYHRYSEIAFVALWAMVVLQRGLTLIGPIPARILAGVWLAFTGFLMGPAILSQASKQGYPMGTISGLEGDLARLGGPALSGRIQCLDATLGGCINVLYRMKLVQSTGSLGDAYLFPEVPTGVTERIQKKFLAEIKERPPKVIVLSAHTWPKETFDYRQVKNWPQFDAYLLSRYAMVKEFPADSPVTAGYRLYLLK